MKQPRLSHGGLHQEDAGPGSHSQGIQLPKGAEERPGSPGHVTLVGGQRPGLHHLEPGPLGEPPDGRLDPPGPAMLEEEGRAGITDLLASRVQFADIIHGDLYSDCHVIPVGTADRAQALRAAGGEVRLNDWPGLWHVFEFYRALPEAARSLDQIAAFLGAGRDAERTAAQ